MTSIYESPEESLPKGCSVCESNLAEVHGCCVTCAMQAAVDNDDPTEAYALAEDWGRPASAVRILIRKRMEDRLRAATREMMAAVRAMPARPVCKRCNVSMRPEDTGHYTQALCGDCEDLAMRTAVAALQSKPANDTQGPPPVAGYTANGMAYWVCTYDLENS
jgi:hypothetical protein